MTAPGWDTQLEPQGGVPDALTGIHGRIHCAATPGATGLDEHETELAHIAIDTFLDPLAEIALAIAQRRQ